MENNPTFLLVVAGAICGPDGRWLVNRRPEGKDHAGLWEFPGGKVEQGETPQESLVRELREELAIDVQVADCEPLAFAERPGEGGQTGIVILLYKITRFAGEPMALEGNAWRWASLAEIDQLPMPPLDRALRQRLRQDLQTDGIAKTGD